MVMHTNTLDIHTISAIKGVDNHKNMPTCTVNTQKHTMIMHTNHSTNTRKVFTLPLMTKCIEWTLEVAFSTTVLQ